ncbi:MAG TPA: PKD domain-containing protein [Hymenobacter sp.]|jgi:hypothetical protein|uniref:PKD domain-containing protein n=1 Tax=Hymenobacter sp. TaxID=1898978 RepID=UPI002EDA236E
MFKKIFIFLAALSAISCEKQGEPDGKQQLKPRVLQASSTYQGVNYEHGLLSFVDQAALDRIADQLAGNVQMITPSASASSNVNGSDPANGGIVQPPPGEYSESVIQDSVLVDFEQQFPGFHSTRAVLEIKRRQLMDADQWTNNNDPDDFYVDSDILRTFLNKDLELKVGPSIYVVANENLIIEIQNSDWMTLEMYRSGDQAYQNSPNVVYHHSAPSTQNSANRPTDCVSGFTALGQSNGSSFIFVPDISDSPDRVYRWEFGDGTISNARQPTHQYLNPGSYVVVLTLGGYCGGYKSSKVVTTVNSSQFCILPTDALNFKVSNVGTSFTFELARNYTSNHTYTWDFGDGAVDTYPAANRTGSFYHNYLQSGTLTVKMYLRNAQGCVFQQTTTVTVPASSCITPGYFNRDKEFEENYLPTKKFKYKLWATNAPFYHRVGAKTKNFERKNGRWRDSKAARVSAKVFGTEYFKDNGVDCGGVGNTFSREKIETNDDKAKTDVGLVHKFQLRKQSLRSAHYVKVDGRRYNSTRQLEID